MYTHDHKLCLLISLLGPMSAKFDLTLFMNGADFQEYLKHFPLYAYGFKNEPTQSICTKHVKNQLC